MSSGTSSFNQEVRNTDFCICGQESSADIVITEALFTTTLQLGRGEFLSIMNLVVLVIMVV